MDAAFWAAQLEAWGIPAEHLSPLVPAAGAAGFSTLVVPGPAIDAPRAADLQRSRHEGISLLVSGAVAPAAARILGLPEGGPVATEEAGLRGPDGIWSTGTDGGAALVWFRYSADRLDWRGMEAVVAAAETTLGQAAPDGLVALWRWPEGKTAALVVDGDVDHPTGQHPQCSRYVRPALETARRAGFDAYGIFAAAANVEAEPASFPPAAYYNHSYSHPYSYWDPRPWEDLEEDEMADQIRRSNDLFAGLFGRGDEGMFRLPHFQLAASDRTYGVLDRLGYRADSSIGGNVSVTGGLPFHPSLEPWSDRPADAAFARTLPDPSRRRALLQLPISTDPLDPSFPHGCCSYNALGEGVRRRTADPDDYRSLLGEVVDRAVAGHGLAHLFIDPPDAGYGRLAGDRIDYAGAVERWLAGCVVRDDVAILTTAGLANWWLDREAAVRRLEWGLEEEDLVVDVPEQPAGTTLAILPPRTPDEARPQWRLLPLEPEERNGSIHPVRGTSAAARSST